MKEHDNIIEGNNQRESTELYISVLIGTQDITYNYNDEFWNNMLNVIICSYVLLIYLIVKFAFIGIDISQSKYIGVCIQGKELIVLLYSYINFCIMTG